MKISLKWLSEFIDLSNNHSPEKLTQLLINRGIEVESIEALDEGLNKVLTAKILKKTPHPHADRLSICLVSTGTPVPLEIVCGAKNMQEGDCVVLAAIGARLPNGVTIQSSKIRGIVSHGMLCSREELHLPKDIGKKEREQPSPCILILEESTPIGMPLAEVLHELDTILTLKLPANRGDCLSHLGIARELSASLEKPLLPLPGVKLHDETKLFSVELKAESDNPQYLGILLEGIQVKPSPPSIIKRLEQLGFASINNIIDATHLALSALGQPFHVYDADCLPDHKLRVRYAHSGEKLTLLNQEEITCKGFELVITNAQDQAVTLAGVMGGASTAIHHHTRRIFIECAEFHPDIIRKTAQYHHLKTESSYRFERGVNPKGLHPAMEYLIYLILKLAGGSIQDRIYVHTPLRDPLLNKEEKTISFSEKFLHDFLGIPIDSPFLALSEIEKIFKNLNCKTVYLNFFWNITPPDYRLDLNTPEDLAEEIARSIGYDCIPAEIPVLSSEPHLQYSAFSEFYCMNQTKEILTKNGIKETIHLPFTNFHHLEDFGLAGEVRVLNAVNKEYTVLNPSLLPGLIQQVLENQNHHFGSDSLSIRIFELRPVFFKSTKVKDSFETGFQENWMLSFALSGNRYQNTLKSEEIEIDFYDVKAIIHQLFSALGTRGIQIQAISDVSDKKTFVKNILPLFHPGKSAEILLNQSLIGYLGLLHPKHAQRLEIRSPLWIAECDWSKCFTASRQKCDFPRFQELPLFPFMERDFSFVLKTDTPVEKLFPIILKMGKPIVQKVRVLDIYQGTQIQPGLKSVTIRIIFYDKNKNLEEFEVETITSKILMHLEKELGVSLRN